MLGAGFEVRFLCCVDGSTSFACWFGAVCVCVCLYLNVAVCLLREDLIFTRLFFSLPQLVPGLDDGSVAHQPFPDLMPTPDTPT